ncbi:MAG: hypothetical protein QNK30_03710 [Bacteroidales bacterium]|nr:hypothetical protein [Bacteroidales bacterium]
MKTKKLFSLLTIILAGTIFFSSCEKEDANLFNETDLALAEDEALSETLFDDVIAAVDDAVQSVDDMIFGGGLKSMIVSEGCPLVTVDHPDEVYWPKVITIDYGTGCEGFYGQTRSGMIKVTINGRYREEGSVKTIELIEYVINGIAVEGTKTIQNLGLNENNNLVFSTSLTGGKITTPNGIVLYREFTREREWVAGANTPNHFDDVYFITGSTTGTNYLGEAYTRTITSPLEWSASCKFIKSGIITSEVEEKETITLDYGDGACDNEAVVSRGEKSKTILLKYKHRLVRP